MGTSQINNTYDVAVVGAGAGGLAVAALLAKANKRVVILEKRDFPGGNLLGAFPNGDIVPNPHYIWGCEPGGAVARFLRKLELADQVKMRKLPEEGFDWIVGPGIDYRVGVGLQAECEKLGLMFPKHRDGLEHYYTVLGKIWGEMQHVPLARTRNWLKLGRQFRTLRKYSRWTAKQFVRQLEFPLELQFILLGQHPIFYAPPSQLSLLAHATGVTSYSRGAYYPEHGFEQFVEQLWKTIIRSPGCDAICGAEATRVIHNGRTATGIQLECGAVVAAERIVLNTDAKLADRLIGASYCRFNRRRVHRQYDYGPSVLSVLVNLPGTVDLRKLGGRNLIWYPSLDIDNVFYSQMESSIPSEPAFFCSSPTQKATIGSTSPQHKLLILSSVNFEVDIGLRKDGGGARERFFSRYSSLLTNKVLKFLQLSLPTEEVEIAIQTPVDRAVQYSAPRGNCYGTPLDTTHVSPSRRDSRTLLRNVFVCHSSTRFPGFATMIDVGLKLTEALNS